MPKTAEKGAAKPVAKAAAKPAAKAAAKPVAKAAAKPAAKTASKVAAKVTKPAAKGAKGGKVATKGKVPKKGEIVAPTRNPLIEARPRRTGTGIRSPTRDLYRFVRWPRYIQLQRKRKILYLRLSVPPAIAQFTKTLDKATAFQVFKLLHKYRPEERTVRQKRLIEIAKARLAARNNKTEYKSIPKPIKNVVYGVNAVTRLVEAKKAKLVVIAHDVDPIDVVVWLPALCRKLDIPYVIVKGKSRLGSVVHKKTTSTLAIAEVNKEDSKDLSNIVSQARTSFNENAEARRQWGGRTLSNKTKAVIAKRQKILAKEVAVRTKANV